MEANVLIPLIAGFTGTIIGALSSVTTILIQQKSQSKRDKIKLACEMAKEDQKFLYETIKKEGLKGSLMPVSVFQHYHFEILSALEEGTLTEDKIIKISAENKKLVQLFSKLNE